MRSTITFFAIGLVLFLTLSPTTGMAGAVKKCRTKNGGVIFTDISCPPGTTDLAKPKVDRNKLKAEREAAAAAARKKAEEEKKKLNIEALTAESRERCEAGYESYLRGRFKKVEGEIEGEIQKMIQRQVNLERGYATIGFQAKANFKNQGTDYAVSFNCMAYKDGPHKELEIQYQITNTGIQFQSAGE